MNQENNELALDKIPVDTHLVDDLYARGNISREARDHILNRINVPREWGLWVSRLMLTLGTILVLSGIIFFFAFNWNRISPFAKLYGIQAAIAVCIILALFFSLNKLAGRLALLSASVLVGVCMAVFGQIYQTGADAWTLFMMWSILTLGWTLVSGFAAQWLFWIAITSIFLLTWWHQDAEPPRSMLYMIYIYLALLNGGALALREYFAGKNWTWLEMSWLRGLLTLSTLICLAIPVIVWILFSKMTSHAEIPILSGALGVAGLIAIFLVYRYVLPDIRSLALTILAFCIIVETLMIRFLFDAPHAGTFFLMSIVTLVIFAIGISYILSTAKRKEFVHA